MNSDAANSSAAHPPRRRRGHGYLPAVALFATILLGSAIWSFTRPRIYQAEAAIEILGPRALASIAAGRQDRIAGGVDLGPSVKLANSRELLLRVLGRIGPAEHSVVFAAIPPAQIADEARLLDALETLREAHPYRLSELVAIRVRHADPLVAARLANLFIQELAALQLAREIELDRRLGVDPQTPGRLLPQQRIGRIFYATTPAEHDYVSPIHRADLGVGCLLGLVASGAVIWRARKRKKRLDA